MLYFCNVVNAVLFIDVFHRNITGGKNVYRAYEGYWNGKFNLTLCTLYMSCGEIAEFSHPHQACEECKITYNHCPWYMIGKVPDSAVSWMSNFWAHLLVIFTLLLFLLSLAHILDLHSC